MLRLSWLALLVGCQSEPSLVVTSPSYGEFLGYGPIVVKGQATGGLTVTVEDQQVALNDRGEFFYVLPWEDRYRCVDVRAFDSDGLEVGWERIPVFDGMDPEESWTDGLTGRVSPAGLERMGPVITDALGDIDLTEGLLDEVQPLEVGPLALTPTDFTYTSINVELGADYEGLVVTLWLQDAVLDVDVLLESGEGFEGPGTLSWDRLGLSIIGQPDVDFDGIISLSVDEPSIVSEGLDVYVEGADTSTTDAIEVAVGIADDWLAEPLLELVTTGTGALELGGPVAFETQLGSSQVAFALTDLDADRHGLGAEIGVDYSGESIEDFKLDVPKPDGELPSGETFHMAVGLHEYLLDEPVTTEITGLLDLSFELDETFGSFLLWWVDEVPGSSQIPDGDGWCMALDPGTASVLRLAEGTDPLGVLYLPDATLTVGRDTGPGCEDWLVMSLALEAGLVASGDRISMDVEVGDGAVLYYGADGQDDAEVVASIQENLGAFLGAAGAVLRIDISDILDGLEAEDGSTALDALSALGELDLSIVDSVQLDEYGEPIEGAYGVAVRIWAEEDAGD